MNIAVLSGKGGTGKTTISTALAELAIDVTRINCDVDAPNLYMFYKDHDIEKSEFIGGEKAVEEIKRQFGGRFVYNNTGNIIESFLC